MNRYWIKPKLVTGCIVLFYTDRLVCYVAKKTWLTETQETYHKFSRKIRILDKPRKKVDKTIAISDDKPGCSHWEDGMLLLDFIVLVQGVEDIGCTLCSQFDKFLSGMYQR